MARVKKTQLFFSGELRHGLHSRCFWQDPAKVSSPRILLGFHPSLSCLSYRTTRHEHSYNNLLYINPCPRRTQAKTVNLGVVFPPLWENPLQGCHQQGLLSSMDRAPVDWSPHSGCSALKSSVLRLEHCSKEQDCEIWDTWVSQIKLKIPAPL